MGEGLKSLRQAAWPGAKGVESLGAQKWGEQRWGGGGKRDAPLQRALSVIASFWVLVQEWDTTPGGLRALFSGS